MAFKDLEVILYDGNIKLDYKDKAHRYYVRDRVDFTLPIEDAKAWGKTRYPKGTTTLLGDTLEKKGLMQWPKNLALRELFGFYDEFTKDDGSKQPAGFSKGVGTLWNNEGVMAQDQNSIVAVSQDEILPKLQSAARAWQRKQKKGADIGSVVHDAIEHYVTANPNVPEPVLDVIPSEDLTDEQKAKLKAGGVNWEEFEEIGLPHINDDGTTQMGIPDIRGSGFDIGVQYMWNIKEAEYETEANRDKALKDFEEDVAQAVLAFEQFTKWWDEARPELVGAEELVYSKEHDFAGTFDGLFKLNDKLVLADWKTSNSYGDAPQGVSYDYFIQSAMYALAYMEMGGEKIDDLIIVSCRKDGGFNTVMASEVGLSIDEALDWAKSVIKAYRMMYKTKKGLLALAREANDD